MATSAGELAPFPPVGTRGVLAVVAHPDDESFGLGAVLDRLRTSGIAVAVVCFTRGGASTLGAKPDLPAVRAAEFAAAAAVLGAEPAVLLDHPDGRLDGVPVDELVAPVRALARRVAPSHLLAFDAGGVTGHPDHIRATRVAVEVGRELGVPVLGWTVPLAVADALNVAFGTAFVGRSAEECDWRVPVDRVRQRAAIAAHRSQARHNRVLWRRLALTGEVEYLRLLSRAGVPGELVRP